MDLSSIDYVQFQYLIERGTAEIIEENDKLCFLYDKMSEIYMLACDDAELGKAAFDQHIDRNYDWIMTTNRELAEYAKKTLGLSSIMECYQYAYIGEMPEEDPRLTLRKADMGDIKTIMAVYHQLDEDEMAENIQRGSVMMAYEGDSLVGFAGEHLEGSQGMLYIYPEHRRKGYASALENACFRKVMKEGRIPFGQVVSDNQASMALQKKKGLKKAEHLYYWVY